MSQIQEMSGITTKQKANQIARQIQQRHPKWIVEVIGDTRPYTVRATPPTEDTADTSGGTTGQAVVSSRTGILGFLDFIAQYESTGNYNAYYGAAANVNDPAFTSMSVNEVLAWQNGRKFSACGKYQIIRQTLSGLVQALELTGQEIYDGTLQDKMGEQLLKYRGLDKFLAGSIPRDNFAFNVAKEWAALPRVKEPHSDRSVYAGDGVNQALVAVPTYLAAIEQLKALA